MHEPVQKLLREAVERALEGLGASDPALLERVAVGPARGREHGDLASNAALVLAKPLGIAPRELARRILSAILPALRPNMPKRFGPMR